MPEQSLRTFDLGAILRLRGLVPGSYVLILALRRDRILRVGRLGEFRLRRGTYLYAGSAMCGLRQRVSRHLSPSKTPHWHVDYLLERAEVVGVLALASPARLECAMAKALAELPGAEQPIPRFGASDCRCSSHLVWLPRRPRTAELVAAVAMAAQLSRSQ